jgi:hypothetical protein
MACTAHAGGSLVAAVRDGELCCAKHPVAAVLAERAVGRCDCGQIGERQCIIVLEEMLLDPLVAPQV